jgi:hypothetical protein
MSPPVCDEELRSSSLATLTAAELNVLASMLFVGVTRNTKPDIVPAIMANIAVTRDLSRGIDVLPDGVQYCDSNTFYRLGNALCSYNCHHGQRKLFFSTLEFMTLCRARLCLSDCVVVYIGAAPGFNMRMIADFFPDAHYLLIDPAPFDIQKSDNITIWNTMFKEGDVDRVLQCKSDLKRSHIVFISDIRLTPAQEAIANDMQLQQRWGIRLKASAMMLKFRLPYMDVDTEVTRRMVEEAEKLSHVGAEVEVPTRGRSSTSYLYLDGSIHLQLYAPLRSAETRLLVFKRDPCTKYAMRYYDYKQYEAKLNAFNVVGRSLIGYQMPGHPDSTVLGKHLLGYSSDYESVAEYQLAHRYLGSPSLSEVVSFLHRLNQCLVRHYSIRVSLVLCSIKTMASHCWKYNDLTPSARSSQLRKISTSAVLRFQKQCTVVRQGDILTDREKREMIDTVAIEVGIVSKRLHMD